MKREKTMTRAQAERLVAATDDEEVLSELLKHPNTHVQMKVRFKRLGSTEARRNATGVKRLGAFLQKINVLANSAAETAS